MQKARAGVPVDCSLPFAPDASIAISGVSVTTITDRDYTITVTSTDTPSGNATFSLPVGQATLGYFEVRHSVLDSELNAVQFTFRISKTTIEAVAIDPANVNLTRHGHGVQSAVPTSRVGDDATHATFRGDSPGLSVFAVQGASTQALPTTTVTPTETTTPVTETLTTTAPTETPATATDDSTTESGTSTPGFGVAVTLLSLLGVALVVLR
ncbi:PGF-pre-PGF domain-containing protein [Halobacterium bonnevillei]|uniref:PGF-pre-PGF domain-containing protein n=1 Tax=Halobacterium bonnevillei TaxID=2692200 RepID=A0A6B0SJT3_9EURY|nr:PGF-pre-PGF domain-containing protein [Halobacterium bonnevillei]MXR19142.1 PGF-pre-PGF domain-containing protein [Halobacterium bonnevillei]